jgi:malate dehydrogenase
MTIWGNHSPSMFPDFFHARVDGELVSDHIDSDWLQGHFLKTVGTRGKAIIEARGASSAASAASAAIDHMSTWENGTAEGEITSMAVASNGQYGAPEGLIFSFPCTVADGQWSVVEGIEHGEFAQGRLQATIDDLVGEREAVKGLLG